MKYILISRKVKTRTKSPTTGKESRTPADKAVFSIKHTVLRRISPDMDATGSFTPYKEDESKTDASVIGDAVCRLV